MVLLKYSAKMFGENSHHMFLECGFTLINMLNIGIAGRRIAFDYDTLPQMASSACVSLALRHNIDRPPSGTVQQLTSGGLQIGA
jgi:hypothetical protein